MNNLKEKVNSINSENIEILKKYVKNNSINELSEFIDILLEICPNLDNNKCSIKNEMILEVGKNDVKNFKKILTSICYNPVVLPFSTNSEDKNSKPIIHIKECNKEINIITIFLENISDINIEDCPVINGTKRYKISFKYKTYFDNNGKNCNCTDYLLDLRINN